MQERGVKFLRMSISFIYFGPFFRFQFGVKDLFAISVLNEIKYCG